MCIRDRLGDIGSNVVISIVDIDEGLTKTVFGTNPPVPDLYPDGRPKLQDRVVGIVKSADGAKIKNQDGELVSAQHGDLVSIWLASWNRWEWTQAKQNLGRPVEVGDLLRWRYLRDEAPSVAGNNPRKVRDCTLQSPSDADAELCRQADKLNDEMEAEKTVRPALTAEPGQVYGDDYGEPVDDAPPMDDPFPPTYYDQQDHSDPHDEIRANQERKASHGLLNGEQPF